MATEQSEPRPPVRSVLDRLAAYQPGRPAEADAAERGVADVIKLASNEGPYPPFPEALDAMAKAAAGAHTYPDASASALRDELGRRLGLDPGMVMLGSGIDGLIGTVVTAFLEPGAELAMCWPSFVSWPLRAQLAGAAVVRAPLRDDGVFDLGALRALVGPRTRLAVVVSPNNPTGGAVSHDDLVAFHADLPATTTMVIDEAYFEFLPDGGHDGLDILRDGGRVVVMRTFSKAFGLAGLRVGYLLAPHSLIAELGKVRPAFDINSVAQAAALASLRSADAHLDERLAEIARAREALVAGLDGLGLQTLPSVANFVLVDFGTEERARAVNEALLDRGVIVRPAAAFGAPSSLRISVGLEREVERALAALREVLAADD